MTREKCKTGTKFVQDYFGNEVAADDEKYVHSNVAARQPLAPEHCQLSVVKYYCYDGDCAKAIYFWSVCYFHERRGIGS